MLTWLLSQPLADQIQRLLQNAPMVLTSDLSLVECERALHRLTHDGSLSLVCAQDRRHRLALAVARWNVMALDKVVVENAKRVFPVEPIRALDALHLATALIARSMVPTLALLSLDRRIRDNGPLLGLAVWP